MPLFHTLHSSFESSDWVRFLSKLPSILEEQPSSSRLLGGRNELYRVENAGQEVAVKRFVNKGLWKRLAYKISSSKAKRSYLHSLALMEAGLNSPQPIAWREEWAGGWLKESHYLCAYLNFEHDASALLDSGCTDFSEKIALLGKAIGQMHEGGLLHLDINQGNWLFARGEGDHWEVSVIDNNRLKRRPVSLGQGVKCLLQLNYPEKLRDAVLAEYAAARGFEFRECKAILDRSSRRFELKWKIKNLTRPWRRKFGL